MKEKNESRERLGASFSGDRKGRKMLGRRKKDRPPPPRHVAVPLKLKLRPFPNQLRLECASLRRTPKYATQPIEGTWCTPPLLCARASPAPQSPTFPTSGPFYLLTNASSFIRFFLLFLSFILFLPTGCAHNCSLEGAAWLWGFIRATGTFIASFLI